MRVKVNDEVLDVSPEESVASIISKLDISTDGIAIALNGSVIPKPNWEDTKPLENDSLLIITATQGG